MIPMPASDNFHDSPRPLYLSVGEFYVGRTFKAGTTSIVTDLGGGGVTWQQLKNDDVRIFVRDPVERLRSAWQMMSDSYSDYLEWPDFVDRVLSGELVDRHWMPQAKIHTWGGRLIPTSFYLFEDIQEWWGKWFNRVLPHRNKSNPREIPEYRREDIKEFYAQDIELRGNSRRS